MKLRLRPVDLGRREFNKDPRFQSNSAGPALGSQKSSDGRWSATDLPAGYNLHFSVFIGFLPYNPNLCICSVVLVSCLFICSFLRFYLF